MKKFFLLMMTAATMLFASSCSKEQISTTISVGEEVAVTLTADLGAIESRTSVIADGKKVNEVAWAIYVEGAATPLPDLQGVLPINGKQGTLEVRLATGRSYDIALFAYYTENPTTEQALTVDGAVTEPSYYQVDWNNKLVAVQYPNGPLANDDDARDCFWYVKKGLEVNAPVNETFTLTRPLAQLNFGVTAEDTADAEAAGLVVTKSKIVASTYTQFNMFTGECLGDLVEYTFAQNNVPTQKLTVSDVDYTYIGTAYLLVDDEKSLQNNVSITIYEDNNTTAVNTLSYDNVPFQRNYRTNILGALLTNPAAFTVKVDERFVDQDGNPTKDYIVKHWDGTSKAVAEVNGTYTVTEPAELAWIAEQVNSGENNFEGKAVVLSVDEDEVIDLNCLNNYLWTPIGTAEKPFKGSFDGNGVIIRNMKVVTPEFAGLFGRVLSDEGIKNVVLEDAVIESSHYAGAVAGHAYADIVGCTVKGLTMNVLPNDTTTRTATYDNGDKAGGIVGYVGEGGYKINNNTVEEATITAYRDLGGIAGAAYIGECTGNIVKKSTLTVDQDVNNYGEKIANLDEVVGRVLGGELGQNTVVEVELVWNPETLKPLTIEEFLNKPVNDKVEYILRGTITAVTNTTYGNFYLTDETGTVLIYGLCSPEGAQKYWAASDAKIGDDIVVKTIRSSYNNTPQGKNAKFVELVSPGTRAFWSFEKEALAFSSAAAEKTIKVDAYNLKNDISVVSDNTQFSATYASGILTVSALENTTTDAISGNITVTCGTLSQVITIKQSGVTVGGVETSVERTMASFGWTNGETVTEAKLDDNVTVTFAQGKAGTAPAYYTSGNAVRLYQNGATMTISAGGHTIKSIELTFASNHYYIAPDCGEFSAEGATRTWTGNAAEVKFTTTGTDKNHRAYVSKIKVVYE